jgi:hypothetical protein
MTILISIASLLGDLIFKVLGNKAAQAFIIKKLNEASKRSDNTIDDTIVKFVASALGNEESLTAVREMYEKHTPRGVDSDLIEQLKAKVASSDNVIDDALVSVVQSALENEKNVDKVVNLVSTWTKDDDSE